MTLQERIAARKQDPTERPRVVSIKPTWIKRMEEKGLPNKDMTLYNGAWQRSDDGGAA